MAFDPNLDKKLFSEVKEWEMTRITVAVCQYNEGIQKLQISRENRKKDSVDWQFAKLGRMIKEEAEAILPLVKKAIEHMD